MYVVAKKHDRQPEIDELQEQVEKLEQDRIDDADEIDELNGRLELEKKEGNSAAVRVVGALSKIDRIHRDGGNELHLDLAHNELEKALTAYQRARGK